MAVDINKKFHVVDTKSGRIVFSTNNDEEGAAHSDKLTQGGGIPHMLMEGIFISNKTSTVIRSAIVIKEEEPRQLVRVGEVVDPSALEEAMEKGGRCNVPYTDLPSVGG